jgi:hypothetical protein
MNEWRTDRGEKVKTRRLCKKGAFTGSHAPFVFVKSSELVFAFHWLSSILLRHTTLSLIIHTHYADHCISNIRHGNVCKAGRNFCRRDGPGRSLYTATRYASFTLQSNVLRRPLWPDQITFWLHLRNLSIVCTAESYRSRTHAASAFETSRMTSHRSHEN